MCRDVSLNDSSDVFANRVASRFNPTCPLFDADGPCYEFLTGFTVGLADDLDTIAATHDWRWRKIDSACSRHAGAIHPGNLGHPAERG